MGGNGTAAPQLEVSLSAWRWFSRCGAQTSISVSWELATDTSQGPSQTSGLRDSGVGPSGLC